MCLPLFCMSLADIYSSLCQDQGQRNPSAESGLGKRHFIKGAQQKRGQKRSRSKYQKTIRRQANSESGSDQVRVTAGRITRDRKQVEARKNRVESDREREGRSHWNGVRESKATRGSTRAQGDW